MARIQGTNYAELLERQRERLAFEDTVTGYAAGQYGAQSMTDPAFLDDVRSYLRDNGKYIVDDDEAVREYIEDMRWQRANTVSSIKRARAAHHGTQEQRARDVRLDNMFDAMPDFSGAGGGVGGAVKDYLFAGVADPVNLVPVPFAAKGVALAATKGVQYAGVKAGREAAEVAASKALKQGTLGTAGRAAAGDAVLGTGIEAGIEAARQKGDVIRGSRDEIDFGEVAKAGLFGGAISAGAGGAIGAGVGRYQAGKGVNEAVRRLDVVDEVNAERAATEAAAPDPSLAGVLPPPPGDTSSLTAAQAAQEARLTEHERLTAEHGRLRERLDAEEQLDPELRDDAEIADIRSDLAELNTHRQLLSRLLRTQRAAGRGLEPESPDALKLEDDMGAVQAAIDNSRYDEARAILDEVERERGIVLLGDAPDAEAEAPSIEFDDVVTPREAAIELARAELGDTADAAAIEARAAELQPEIRRAADELGENVPELEDLENAGLDAPSADRVGRVLSRAGADEAAVATATEKLAAKTQKQSRGARQQLAAQPGGGQRPARAAADSGGTSEAGTPPTTETAETQVPATDAPEQTEAAGVVADTPPPEAEVDPEVQRVAALEAAPFSAPSVRARATTIGLTVEELEPFIDTLKNGKKKYTAKSVKAAIKARNHGKSPPETAAPDTPEGETPGTDANVDVDDTPTPDPQDVRDDVAGALRKVERKANADDPSAIADMDALIDRTQELLDRKGAFFMPLGDTTPPASSQFRDAAETAQYKAYVRKYREQGLDKEQAEIQAEAEMAREQADIQAEARGQTSATHRATERLLPEQQLGPNQATRGEKAERRQARADKLLKGLEGKRTNQKGNDWYTSTEAADADMAAIAARNETEHKAAVAAKRRPNLEPELGIVRVRLRPTDAVLDGRRTVRPVEGGGPRYVPAAGRASQRRGLRMGWYDTRTRRAAYDKDLLIQARADRDSTRPVKRYDVDETQARRTRRHYFESEIDKREALLEQPPLLEAAKRGGEDLPEARQRIQGELDELRAKLKAFNEGPVKKPAAKKAATKKVAGKKTAGKKAAAPARVETEVATPSLKDLAREMDALRTRLSVTQEQPIGLRALIDEMRVLREQLARRFGASETSGGRQQPEKEAAAPSTPRTTDSSTVANPPTAPPAARRRRPVPTDEQLASQRDTRDDIMDGLLEGITPRPGRVLALVHKTRDDIAAIPLQHKDGRRRPMSKVLKGPEGEQLEIDDFDIVTIDATIPYFHPKSKLSAQSLTPAEAGTVAKAEVDKRMPPLEYEGNQSHSISLDSLSPSELAHVTHHELVTTRDGKSVVTLKSIVRHQHNMEGVSSEFYAANRVAFPKAYRTTQQILAKLAPNGVRFPAQQLTESLNDISNVLHGQPTAAVEHVLQTVRSLRGEVFPSVIEQDLGTTAAGQIQPAGTESGRGVGVANKILINEGLTKGRIRLADVSASQVLTHELGHWVYLNLLTPQDKLDFWDVIDGYIGPDGQPTEAMRNRVSLGLDKVSVVRQAGEPKLEPAAVARKKAAAVRERSDHYVKQPQEFFAEQFSMWLWRQSDDASLQEAKLWRKVAMYVEALIERYFHGNPIDPQLEVLFSKLIKDDGEAAVRAGGNVSTDQLSPTAKTNLRYYRDVNDNAMLARDALRNGDDFEFAGRVLAMQHDWHRANPTHNAETRAGPGKLQGARLRSMHRRVPGSDGLLPSDSRAKVGDLIKSSATNVFRAARGDSVEGGGYVPSADEIAESERIIYDAIEGADPTIVAPDATRGDRINRGGRDLGTASEVAARLREAFGMDAETGNLGTLEYDIDRFNNAITQEVHREHAGMIFDMEELPYDFQQDLARQRAPVLERELEVLAGDQKVEAQGLTELEDKIAGNPLRQQQPYMDLRVPGSQLGHNLARRQAELNKARRILAQGDEQSRTKNLEAQLVEAKRNAMKAEEETYDGAAPPAPKAEVDFGNMATIEEVLDVMARTDDPRVKADALQEVIHRTNSAAPEMTPELQERLQKDGVQRLRDYANMEPEVLVNTIGQLTLRGPAAKTDLDLALMALAARRQARPLDDVPFFAMPVSLPSMRGARTPFAAMEHTTSQDMNADAELLLDAIDHRVPGVQQAAREIMFRLLSLHEALNARQGELSHTTPGHFSHNREEIPQQITVGTLGRMAYGPDSPFPDDEFLISDPKNQVFTILRDSVRSAAVALRTGKNVDHHIEELTNLVLSSPAFDRHLEVMRSVAQGRDPSLVADTDQLYTPGTADAALEQRDVFSKQVAAGLTRVFRGEDSLEDALPVAFARADEGGDVPVEVDASADAMRLELAEMAQDAMAMLVNGLVVPNTVRERYRSLTWRGNLTQDARVPSYDDTMLEHGGIDPMHATDVSASYRRRMGPKLMERMKTFVRNGLSRRSDGSMEFFWSGVPDAGFTHDPNTSLRRSSHGDSGHGVYLTSNPMTARTTYAELATMTATFLKVRNALVAKGMSNSDAEKAADTIHLKLNEKLNVERTYRELDMEAVKAADDANYTDDELELLIDDLEVQRSKLDAQLSRINTELAGTGLSPSDLAMNPQVMPVVVRAQNMVDLREGVQLEESAPWLQAVLAEGFARGKLTQVDLDEIGEEMGSYNQTAYAAREAFEQIARRLVANGAGDNPVIPGKAYHNGRNLVNEMLEARGYEGLRTTERASAGPELHGLPHDTYVIFNPDNVAHAMSSFSRRQELNRDDLFFAMPMDLTAPPETMPMRVPVSAPPQEAVGRVFHDIVKSEPELRKDAAKAMNAMGRGRKLTGEMMNAIQRGMSFAFGEQSQYLKEKGLHYAGDFLQRFHVTQNQRLGRRVVPLLQELRKLSRAEDPKGLLGTLTRHARSIDPRKGRHVAQSHKDILSVLRTGREESPLYEALPDEQKALVRKIGKTLDDEHTDLQTVEAMVGYKRNYFPQVWDPESIKQNLDGFNARLRDYLVREADDRDEALDDEKLGQLVNSIRSSILGEEGSVIRGAVSGGEDHLDYQRMINIDNLPATDRVAMMEALSPFMEQDLEYQLTKYLDSSARRYVLNKQFGQGMHGYSDYLYVAQAGADAVAELLSTTKVTRKTGLMGHDGSSYDVKSTSPMPLSRLSGEDRMAQVEKIVSLVRDGQAASAQALIYKIHGESFPGKPISRTVHKRIEAVLAGLEDTNENGLLGQDSDGLLKRAYGAERLMNNKPLENSQTYAHGRLAQGLSKGVRAFNNVTLLGYATLASLPDVVLPLVRSGSFTAFAQGIGRLARDDNYRAALQRVGVDMETLLHQRLINGYGADISGKLGRGQQAYFNLTMLTPWTSMMRQMSGSVGYHTMQAEFARARSGGYKPGVPIDQQPTRKARTAARFLKQFDLDKYLESGQTPDMGNEDVQRAMIQFTNETIFSPTFNDLPLYAQTPIGALVMQLKSFPLMMQRFAKRNLIDDIKNGDGRRAAYLLAAAPAIGAVSLGARDIVQNRGEDDNTFRKRNFLKSIGHDKEVHGDEDDYLGWWLEGALAVGGLGLLADLVQQSAAQLDNGAYGQQRIGSLLLGPTLGSFNEGLNVASGATDALFDTTPDSNAKERAGVRSVVGRVPFLGGNVGRRDSIVDAIAGPSSDDSSGSGGFGGQLGGGFGGSSSRSQGFGGGF